MGRTIPSFRIVLEGEIYSWKDLRKTLSMGNQKLLDSLFNQTRSSRMAAGNAVRPIVFEGMFMAIAFSHEKRLANIERVIEELRIEMNQISTSFH